MLLMKFISDNVIDGEEGRRVSQYDNVTHLITLVMHHVSTYLCTLPSPIDSRWTPHGLMDSSGLHLESTKYCIFWHFRHGLHLDLPGFQVESTWTPHGLHMESTWTPHGIHMESTWNPHGIHMDSKWSR